MALKQLKLADTVPLVDLRAAVKAEFLNSMHDFTPEDERESRLRIVKAPEFPGSFVYFFVYYHDGQIFRRETYAAGYGSGSIDVMLYISEKKYSDSKNWIEET